MILGVEVIVVVVVSVVGLARCDRLSSNVSTGALVYGG